MCEANRHAFIATNLWLSNNHDRSPLDRQNVGHSAATSLREKVQDANDLKQRLINAGRVKMMALTLTDQIQGVDNAGADTEGPNMEARHCQSRY